MQTIKIPYRPRAQQRQVHCDPARFLVLLAHRRFGKTVLCVNHQIRLATSAEATRRGDWRAAYIAPLYKQAKAVAWDYFKFFAQPIPGTQFHNSDLRVDFANGARITLYGADNPDSLRGIYLDDVVFDEVAQMPESMWKTIIRPALADRKGCARFIGTPQGKNLLYEMFQRAGNMPGWSRHVFRASETGIIDPEELEAAKREMDPDEFEQEFECSFTAAIKGAYFAQRMSDARREQRIGRVPYDPAVPVWTAWDLGMSDSTAIWFVQLMPGGSFAVIDYYEATGEGLEHYANVLNNKGYHYGGHIAPHDIRVRELGTGKSRLETAAKLGIRFRICPSLPVTDGINAVRNILPRCWFDEQKCADGITSLEHYRRTYNDRTLAFSSAPLHDWTSHAVDAFRYFTVGIYEKSNQTKNMPTSCIED